jgi:D-alanyl-D-alanine carboxypeptidase
MKRWLAAAIDSLPRWIELQTELTEPPGCSLAVAHRGKVVLEAALAMPTSSGARP